MEEEEQHISHSISCAETLIWKDNQAASSTAGLTLCDLADYAVVGPSGQDGKFGRCAYLLLPAFASLLLGLVYEGACFTVPITLDNINEGMLCWLQPKEIKEIKDFLLTARRKDAKSVRIKKNSTKGITKFKVRCSKYLYTLSVTDSDKADKLKQSLPPGKLLSVRYCKVIVASLKLLKDLRQVRKPGYCACRSASAGHLIWQCSIPGAVQLSSVSCHAMPVLSCDAANFAMPLQTTQSAACLR